jgi:hypothetical protein
MVGKAKSEELKRRVNREEADGSMDRAIKLYLNEQQVQGNEKKMGYRKVCEKVEEDHRKETGHTVKLNHNTLANHVKGGKSLTQFNAEKAWLTETETKVVINYTVEYGDHGFPLSHCRLKEHVDSILHARLHEKFPETGVGHNWTQRFITAHHDELKTSWAQQLDTVHGRAVNATNHTEWIELLGGTIEDVDTECIWAADETGFQMNGAIRERVIGRAGKSTQYQQRDGNRENITVIVTICADGTSIALAVIFKRKSYLPEWKQDNPLEAS